MKKIIKYLISLIILAVIVIMSWVNMTQINKNRDLNQKKDINFYITTDLHYLSNRINDHGAAFQKYLTGGDGKQLGYITDIMTAFTDQVKQTKPDILIVSGDLTNNGEKDSHLDLAKTFHSIEKKGTKVYVIPGNHDISNPWARGFKADKQYVTDTISPKDFSDIYADFGYKEAISRDKSTLSYLVEPMDDLWLLMLDTSRYKDNQELGYPEADGILSTATLNWIEDCAAKAKEKGARIIAVMHHNMMDHSEIVRDGFTLNDSGQAQLIFRKSNIYLVFSGHIHAQDISSDHKEKPLYDIASNALSVYPHQYGELNYSRANKTLDYHTTKLDVETWAKKSGVKDENLLNFAAYSRESFGQLASNRAIKKLAMETDYSEEQMKLMAETMEELNINFFAGTENENSDDIIKSEGYQLWMSMPENRQQSYINSIIHDKDMDDNQLHIDLTTN